MTYSQSSSVGERSLVNECNDNESLFKFDVTTDDNGAQTRWILKKARNIILHGPPPGTKYNSNSNYVETLCLPHGTYKVFVFDNGNDGLVSPGKYTGYLDGKKKFGSPSGEKKWNRRVHPFTINKTSSPSSKPTNSANDVSCSSSESKVKVEIKTDKWGVDTSWEIANAQGQPLIESNKVYGSYEKETRIFCLDKGSSYDFILRDKVGDGMSEGESEGYFKVSLFNNGSWSEIISGGAFRSKELTHVINLEGTNMTPRDIEWLDSHNIRRRKWHTSNGKTYGTFIS